ncbi:MAG: GNAT family N-acetyltransferase [Actinomycetota bacterium]|nr:GNAT family N-acetyltransferase [Actinomycetota bacterium]
MSAPSLEVIRWGRERARSGSWRGDPQIAYLAPAPDAPPPSAPFVLRCLDTLASRGFTRVVTGALGPLEQAGFLAAGFDISERLHLLGIDLDDELPALPAGARLARAGHRRRGVVLAIDHHAFSQFWQFDADGLTDALHATPHTRFRVALDGPTIAGYAICGRAGGRGFVQRLAVDPARHRQGLGRRLLLDGLHWLRRRRVRHAVVNTQTGNLAALALYRQVGFVDEPTGLIVLSVDLARS